jgi:hypothetical protein
MDQGVHDVRLLMVAGDPGDVRNRMAGLADWISAPPFALAHLPIGEETPAGAELAGLSPASVRLTACKRSWDGRALILRCQETLGEPADAVLRLRQPAVSARLPFKPFEIKTVRFERDGSWKEVAMIEEEPGS